MPLSCTAFSFTIFTMPYGIKLLFAILHTFSIMFGLSLFLSVSLCVCLFVRLFPYFSITSLSLRICPCIVKKLLLRKIIHIYTRIVIIPFVYCTMYIL